MNPVSPKNSTPDVKNTLNDWRLVVAGYSIAAIGLVAFLTINGVSGISMAATMGTAFLVVIGFLLSILGMLLLRRSLGPPKSMVQNGFALQAFGLLSLLFGVVLVVATSSLSGYLLSAVFVIAARVSAIGGAIISRRHFVSALSSNARTTAYLIFATALIFLGVGLIVGSNIAFQHILTQIQNTIFVDIGATVSACGCILTAYSFFVLSNRR